MSIFLKNAYHLFGLLNIIHPLPNLEKRKIQGESISLKPIKTQKKMGQICWVHNLTAVLHRWFRNLLHLVKILEGAHITNSDNGICLEII